MRKSFLLLGCFFGLSALSALWAGEVEPVKEEDPDDTLKVYYLDEVVVSRPVKETNDLRRLPTAVSVLSPRQLRDAHIESLPGLSSFVPNFFIPSYGSKVSTPIYIRGVGARLGAQTVSLYIDNVPSFNPSAYDFEFQDIQRVEVLRGAQGTLYGRNAIGGIVNVYTLSPLSFQGSRLMISGGNYGHFVVKGSDYRKFSDRLGISLAGYYRRDDGYFTNRFTGKRADGSENAGGRLRLDWQLSDRFSASLFGNYDYLSGGAFPYMHRDSSMVNYNELSSYDRKLATTGLSLDFMGNGFTVHSTTGFQYLDDDMKMDQDYTPQSVFSIHQMQKQHSLSQEISVKSEGEGDYRWVIGAFGFYDRRKIDTPVALKEDAVAAMESFFSTINDNPNIPVTIHYANDRIDLPGVYTKPSRGAALFHQSSLLDLFGVEGLSATAGIRFDYEHTGIDYSTESQGGDVEVTVPRVGQIPVDGDTLLTGSYQKDFWEILPKFALQYSFSSTSQVYLSVSKGYKSGGYNEQLFSQVLQDALQESLMRNVMLLMPSGMSGIPGMPFSSEDEEDAGSSLEEQLSYDPETSWTYELGGRYEMFENRMSLAYAFFYTHVNNIQIIQLKDQGTAGRTVTNAGKSESKGFELSVRYAPDENLSLFADYGFADARFLNYTTEKETDDGVEEADYSGNHIPFAPSHTLSVGASYVYRLPYGSVIDRLSANVHYQGAGRIYWTESNRDFYDQEKLYQPFYGITNVSVSAEKGAFALECRVENLFDTKYDSFLFEASDMTTGKSNIFVQRGNPLTFEATLRYTFDR